MHSARLRSFVFNEIGLRMDTRRCLALLWLVLAQAGCGEANVSNSEPAGAKPQAVADAQLRCAEASKEPAPSTTPSFTGRLPIEVFDECIAAEANKWSIETREAICALGKSGGEFGSTVEVYMADGKCWTDYE